MIQKILVCITIQENSKRLITEGHKLATLLKAPLHILHIRKGETVFDHPDSSTLLEELFNFGGELGGEVHFLCSNNILQTITEFIDNNQMTHLVIGETPNHDSDTNDGISTILKEALNHITIDIVPRNEDLK